MNSYSEGAQGRGPYMWLLFVRNGACGGGKEEEREGGVRGLQWRCSHSGLCIYMCECVNACLFEEEKECVSGVWTGFRVLMRWCAGGVRERETGQRVKVITL